MCKILAGNSWYKMQLFNCGSFLERQIVQEYVSGMGCGWHLLLSFRIRFWSRGGKQWNYVYCVFKVGCVKRRTQSEIQVARVDRNLRKRSTENESYTSEAIRKTRLKIMWLVGWKNWKNIRLIILYTSMRRFRGILITYKRCHEPRRKDVAFIRTHQSTIVDECE